MSRPVVGIICNKSVLNDDYEIFGGGTMNVEAVSDVVGAMPVLIPTDPNAICIDTLMDRCDGFLFTGGRPNVHPEEYGESYTDAHGVMDRDRDAIALPLIRALVERGQPLLGICRGFQEVAVAFGSTLYPEIRDLPGRMNHRMPPDGTMEEKFALRHSVTLETGGMFHQLWGKTEIMTNTLHGQGIKTPGPRVVIEGYAPDGTPEAIHIAGAAGFTMSVQWHPEWQAGLDPVSRPLFEAFGRAVSDWAMQGKTAAQVAAQ